MSNDEPTPFEFRKSPPPKREADPALMVLLFVLVVWLASLPVAAGAAVMPPKWLRYTILALGGVALVGLGYFLNR